jgi:hypothetical protein
MSDEPLLDSTGGDESMSQPTLGEGTPISIKLAWTVFGAILALGVALNAHWSGQIKELRDEQVKTNRQIMQTLWEIQRDSGDRWKANEHMRVWVLEAEKKLNKWARDGFNKDVELPTVGEITGQ